jgi:N-acetylglucosaminyl-diphospho-decaprenol L-rhamnosyltransferase
MTGVSVVVVDFHAGAHLKQLIDSLDGEAVGTIIVVDNSTVGATAESLAGHGNDVVEILEAERNAGFGAGVNLAMTRAEGEFVVVSNPDVVVAPGAVSRLLEAVAADESLAIAGPAIFEDDGSIHQSARAFPSVRRSGLQAFAGLLRPGGHLAERYRRKNWQASAERYVDWVSGAFFVVRRAAFDAVGGFDERYFLYVEEVDLCWRLQQAGWKVAYVPAAHVTHTGGVSGAGHPYRTASEHHRSLWRFVRATTERRDRWLLGPAAAAIWLRFVLVCGRITLERVRNRAG